jgi:hypothetical protein
LGLYIPNAAFLSLGAALGLCGLIYLILVARSGEAGAAAALAVGALAVALGMRVDGEGYSVSSEVVRAPEQAIERMLVVAEVDETLVPVFAHSFQPSLVSAPEANGIEALIGPSPVSGDPIEADTVLSITVEPLYRTNRDGSPGTRQPPSSGPSWSTSRVASPCGSIPTPRPGNATGSEMTRTRLKTTVSAWRGMV